VLLGVGGQGQDLIAGVEDLLSGFQDQVEGSKAGHLLGGAGVDVLDPGMSVRAAQNEGVQHPRTVDVVGVLGLAGGLGGPVQPLDLGADDSAFLRP